MPQPSRHIPCIARGLDTDHRALVWLTVFADDQGNREHRTTCLALNRRSHTKTWGHGAVSNLGHSRLRHAYARRKVGLPCVCLFKICAKV